VTYLLAHPSAMAVTYVVVAVAILYVLTATGKRVR
jgi:hypothetical protein